MSCEAAEVLGEARRLVERARRVEPAYGGATAPLGGDALLGLMRRVGCRVEVFPFQSAVGAMACPEGPDGYPVFVNATAEAVDRAFALRHELAHVLAGEVQGAVFAHEAAEMDATERVADLFALVDLVPGWVLEWVREEGGEAALDAEAEALVAPYAAAWTATRLADRAHLRLELLRAHGM